MNLAYFRKSNFSKEKTLSNLKSKAIEMGFEVISETNLEDKHTTLLNVCSKEWLQKLIKEDQNLIGVLPCSILIAEKDDSVNIGVGNPAILQGVSQSPKIHTLAAEAEEKLRKLINESAGVEDLKPTNVIVYSTKTCPYCTMEKEWLEDNKVKHEVVYLETNQEAGKRMVEATGQMGVPVTEIVYGEGESEFIIGFNKAVLQSKVL